MATWIVHLRIAEQLLGKLTNLDEAHFAMGNIAPDSGIPDERWEKFTPPGEVTHFHVKRDGERICGDFDFYRRYLAPVECSADNTARVSFLAGYFFHLLTDNLWARAIAIPTQRRFAAEFEADHKFIWTVKRDWYGLDFEHVRMYRDSLFWRVFLTCQYTNDWLDFLPVPAITRNIEHIKEFYQRTDPKTEEWFVHGRPRRYLSRTEMDQFVEQSAQTLLDIYCDVREKRPNSLSYSSLLELKNV